MNCTAKYLLVWATAEAACIGAIAQSYSVTDLGVLGRPEMQLNNLSQVTGTTLANHAFRWERGVVTTLGTLGTTSFGREINDTGQIAGYSYNGSTMRAALFPATNLIDLGALSSAVASYAIAINNAGQVVGYTVTGPGSYPYVATLWQGGNVTNLGTLFGYFSRASGINNSGTIVGMSDNHAFVCTPARGMQLLPDPSGCIYSSAEAINDAGVIVGSTSPTNFSCAVHAVVWKDGKATDIGLLIPPTAFASIYAYAINSAEVIVGDADTLTGTHAIIYDVTDGMRDLNTLIAPSSGWVLTSSAAINDSGQILGLGQQGGANPELICLLLEAIS